MQQPYAGNLSSILYDPYGRVIDTTERDLPGGLDFFYWRPQLFALSQWTSEAAYNHASAHETGDFATSATLFRAVTQDPRVSDGYTKRALALRGVRYRVTPGPGPYGALLAAKFEQIISTKTPVSNERPRLRTQQTTIDQMGLALLMGPGLQQLKWKLYSDEWNPMVPVSQAGWYYPQVDPWEPDAVRWNGWRYVARCITSVRGDAWLEVPVEQGTGQWFTLSLFGGFRPHMAAHLRTLWRPWFSRLHAMRMWLRFDDVHGLPIRFLKVPMGMRRTKELRDFYDQVDNLGSDATLQGPMRDDGKAAVDLELKEAKSESWKSFVEKFRTMGAEITITLTGGTQNTEATGGNYKGAEEQREIRHEVKQADALADALPPHDRRQCQSRRYGLVGGL